MNLSDQISHQDTQAQPMPTREVDASMARAMGVSINDNAHTGAAMPPKTQRIRDISITPLDRGYNVRVGCQVIAVSTTHELLEKLTRYITNPEAVESAYQNGAF